MDEATLAAYQARLLALLQAGAEPEAIVAALRGDPALASLRDYIDGLDPHALTVAVQLVARWGSGTEPADSE